MDDAYALITGGSGGIGLELAKLFAADKIHLILVSRNGVDLHRVRDQLIVLYNVKVECIQADLSEHESAARLYAVVNKLNVKVLYLVNNAGFGLHTEFSKMSQEKAMKMIELNVNTLVSLTRYFLDDMVSREKGYILNIASTAAFAPGPYMAIYYATKAFVVSFSESVAMELKGSGVHVMAACPGPVKTNFQLRAHLQRSNIFIHQNVMSAENTAKLIYKRLKRKRILTIIGFMNFLNIFFLRFLPRILIRNITAWLNQKPTSKR